MPGNPRPIGRVQAPPDTTIMMGDGATFVGTEEMDDVIARITPFRAGVLAPAAPLAAAGFGDTRPPPPAPGGDSWWIRP
ncbi:flagellar FlbD family protein, partial [Microbacterium sp. GbtcB4]|uniref:flagellar FlbD family protein n=1 Tax=Microbacterium sp. GbtcB4 TaxID=2824749 RepID=UPI001C304625